MNTYADKLSAALAFLGSNYQLHPEYDKLSNVKHPRISSAYEMHKFRVRRVYEENF